MTNRLSHRTLIILIATLIGLTLLVGTVRAFAPVRAAVDGAALSGAARLAPTHTPSATVRATRSPHASTPSPSPTPTETPTATPTPTGPVLKSPDTGGIIAMSVLLVMIVLFGVLWTARIPGKPGEKKKVEPRPKREKKTKTGKQDQPS
ncbi:MAG: hypothetical protein JXB85_08120 [Anaerolineales bacterium]|nr:hypothetical protein [Anaerolineales bacterium]